MPNLNPNAMIYDGAFGDGARVIINTTYEQQLVANITPVQATNPTAATNLMTANLNAGTFSTVGQSLEFFAAGIVNLTTTTATLTIAVILGGVTIATFTSGLYAISLNLPWNVSLLATVASFIPAGGGLVGGSVTLEVHGTLQASLTTAAGATTAYNDTNTAVSSSITNFATPTLLQVQATISAGNAASFVNQRQMCVELLN